MHQIIARQAVETVGSVGPGHRISAVGPGELEAEIEELPIAPPRPIGKLHLLDHRRRIGVLRIEALEMNRIPLVAHLDDQGPFTELELQEADVIPGPKHSTLPSPGPAASWI